MTAYRPWGDGSAPPLYCPGPWRHGRMRPSTTRYEADPPAPSGTTFTKPIKQTYRTRLVEKR